jgi:hypothetical protein
VADGGKGAGKAQLGLAATGFAEMFYYCPKGTVPRILCFAITPEAAGRRPAGNCTAAAAGPGPPAAAATVTPTQAELAAAVAAPEPYPELA